MKLVFWGTRGSLPTPLGYAQVRAKVLAAVTLAARRGLSDPDDAQRFVDEDLAFHERGTFGGNTSCVQLLGGRDYLILDAGSGLRELGASLMRSGLGAGPATFRILLSHLHWDHLQGFPFFTPAYIPGNRVEFYGGHPGIAEALAGQQAEPFFPVPLSYLGGDISFHRLDPAEELAVDGWRIRLIPQHHPGGSFGYRLDRDGASVVYSTDCEHKEEVDKADYPFVKFIAGADVLVFDAQYNFAESVTAKQDWGHSSNLVGVELAARAGVRHLVLHHHDPLAGDVDLQKILAGARSYAALSRSAADVNVSMAYDGLEITVPGAPPGGSPG